ncbi:MAG: hypothetical protein H0U09_16300 [Geodermatophilaceae bacterium]|nr:hypothetical protein [Geodermatophilaceae bacterium]
MTVRGDRREFHDLCELSDLPTPLLDRLGRWDEPVERPGETWGSYADALRWLSSVGRST